MSAGGDTWVGNGTGSDGAENGKEPILKVSFVAQETKISETLLVEIDQARLEWLLDVCREHGRRAAFVELKIKDDLNPAVEVVPTTTKSKPESKLRTKRDGRSNGNGGSLL